MFPQLSDKERNAYALIRAQLLKGLKVTLRQVGEVIGSQAPRSAVLVIDRLINKGLLVRDDDGLKLTDMPMERERSIETIPIPLVGVVTCGEPMLAEQNIEAHIHVSTGLAKPGHRYFMLRATGKSMNLAGINDGDILLVRQQSTADNGATVVALVDEEATVKTFEKKGNVVILRPQSTESKYKPIIVTENCMIQGQVIAVLPPDIV